MSKNKETKDVKTVVAEARELNKLIGPHLSFAAAEAYKLLRANLMFSTSDQEHGKIIGITSSIRGEGKTTTSLNLAYTLAEADKQVLLIDGDLRLPKIAKNLALKSRPGFSNLIAGMTRNKIPVQNSGLTENLFVMAAGDIPPNPSELLGSKAAESALDALREKFDYIIVDLPPVNIVSDALVLNRVCDGFLIVVRQDYTARGELSSCVERMEYVRAKILGFVMTHRTVGDKNYRYNKRYYSRYGSKYSRKYGYDKYGYERYGYERSGGNITEKTETAAGQ